MAANTREAQRRRRRITEQGSDRLALITGRIQTLPPLSVSDADAGSSSQPQPQPQPLIPDGSSTAVSPRGETEESDSTLLSHDSVTEPYHSDVYESRSTTPLQEPEEENEISIVPTSEDEHAQPPPDDSSVDISGTRQHSQPQTEEPKRFIPSEISSAINASKSIRLCCSAAVALLVVLSHLGFSLIGSNFFKSIISFRPLYLVLVTNLTVVVARLLSGKQRGYERSERRQNETSSDGDNWGTQLARTLEAGMVMQNVVDAVFMDCAIYAIIVTCGLSLVQKT